MFSREVGENLAGRTGGAVSLAVGMAQIFRGMPGMDRLMGYWYHYAIMFEALFILTYGGRGNPAWLATFCRKLMSKLHKPFGNSAWLPEKSDYQLFRRSGLGLPDLHRKYFHHIWPMFGTGNQIAGNHRAGGDDNLPH